ncbi:hypothetical protein F2Q69_00036209 [Brassica cretica]|uniref:Uncharacterized protein n=1 Tax=Brassica cretica TaxID=69181 RepID=A0A8S9SLR0_BRACR|nr:hypothetical protein F2Q69_00036209 [Brassica cretica]
MVTVKGRDLCLRRHKIESMPSRGIIITIKTWVADKAGRPTSCNSDIHLRVWGTVLIKEHPQDRPARGGTSVNGHRSLRLGIEFLETPCRTPASGSPLGDAPGLR